MNANSAIVYHGPSMLHANVEIVVILTGLDTASSNAKTGEMLQTWILRADVAPNAAIKSGLDSAICGDCRHRGTTCYVQMRAPVSIWNAYKRGAYRHVESASELRALTDGRKVRIGSYGDPAAVPAHVWHWLTFSASHHTGYTHQWRTVTGARRDVLQRLVMASCDTESEREQATRDGWRTFRVRTAEAPLLDSEIACPASDESGHKSQCAKCRLCAGQSSKARVDVAIVVHGARKRQFAA